MLANSQLSQPVGTAPLQAIYAAVFLICSHQIQRTEAFRSVTDKKKEAGVSHI